MLCPTALFGLCPVSCAGVLMSTTASSFDLESWNHIQDTVTSVAHHDASRAWSWSGRALLLRGGERIQGYAHLNEACGEGTFEPHDRSLLHRLDSFRGKKVQMQALDEFAAGWTLSGCRIRRRALAAVAYRVPVKFDSVKFERQLDGNRSDVFRIVFAGVTLPDYTYGRWVETERGARLQGYSILDVFGRRLIISELRESSDGQRYLAATFAAPFLGDLELDEIDLVLYYLCGSGGVRQVVESYDRDGRRVARSFHRHGHASAEVPRPILPHQRYGEPETWAMLSRVVGQAAELIQRGFPLRAILYQMFAGLQRVPELRIIHLGIALDAIKNATVVTIRGEGKVIADQELFRRRIAPALRALESEFSSEADREPLELIKRRLEGANDWSERERWKRFWRDVVAYELEPDERETLDHRDVAVHTGYILDTEYDLALASDNRDRRPYGERLADLDRDSRVFQNIVDRVLLRLLGMSGTFRDARDNIGELEIGEPNDGWMAARLPAEVP